MLVPGLVRKSVRQSVYVWCVYKRRNARLLKNKKRWKRIAQAGRVGRARFHYEGTAGFLKIAMNGTSKPKGAVCLVHMTFTDFERSPGQASHGLGTEQKRDELLVASMSLSGPASVSRPRANGR